MASKSDSLTAGFLSSLRFTLYLHTSQCGTHSAVVRPYSASLQQHHRADALCLTASLSSRLPLFSLSLPPQQHCAYETSHYTPSAAVRGTSDQQNTQTLLPYPQCKQVCHLNASSAAHTVCCWQLFATWALLSNSAFSVQSPTCANQS